MRHRQEEIRAKGFSLGSQPINPQDLDFSRLRRGIQDLQDCIVDVNNFKKVSKKYGDKETVLKALANRNLEELREISKFFFETSGIYSRMVKYLACLFRYDWFIVPKVIDENVSEDKVLAEFTKVLDYMDNSQIQQTCESIALKVILEGCHYLYVKEGAENFEIQELPVKYCRTRFTKNGRPVVEFLLKYFDDCFPDIQYRLKILKIFPEEFSKAYMLYKQGKLPAQFQGDSAGWYILDPDKAFKFNCGDSDVPFLANAIPAIIDLDAAQELDRRKQMQKLLKILIQKLPTDKNGELLFDLEEAQDLHNNAVMMLKKAIGVDILTTFADIDVANLSDSNSATTTDDLKKVERTVFNSFGTSNNLFNADTNTALNNSILNDEAAMRGLIKDLQSFYNVLVSKKFNTKPKKYKFNLRILETTIYNYKELSKMYKEQVQIGYSKMLPQIALGHNQSEILATAHFENRILHLSKVMIPPLSTNTLSGADLAEILGEDEQELEKKNQNPTEGKKEENSQNQNKESAERGRPELNDNEKSEKTLANRESL